MQCVPLLQAFEWCGRKASSQAVGNLKGFISRRTCPLLNLQQQSTGGGGVRGASAARASRAEDVQDDIQSAHEPNRHASDFRTLLVIRIVHSSLPQGRLSRDPACRGSQHSLPRLPCCLLAYVHQALCGSHGGGPRASPARGATGPACSPAAGRRFAGHRADGEVRMIVSEPARAIEPLVPPAAAAAAPCRRR